MKEHGLVRSTEKPERLVVDENSVWVAEEINEVSENLEEENEFIGYEYQLKQYTKDEYIVYLDVQRELDKTETNLALAELATVALGGAF